MKPDIQIGSKIKVVDRGSQYYRWRGVVSAEKCGAVNVFTGVAPVEGFVCTLHNGIESGVKVELKLEQIACIQKKFIDIEQLREEDVDLGNGVIRHSNVGAFEVDDTIQISEKIDGANASIAWNADEDCLEVFSRTNLLSGADGLRGFKSYIDINVLPKLKEKHFATKYPNIVIFGEWLVSHSCQYDKDCYNKWYVYDIWDKTTKNYLKQLEVKKIVEELGLTYVHELYNGPFVSWNHCRSFMSKKTYGPQQEGVVVKNQTKIDNDEIRFPKVLKIVNKEFIESHLKKEKKPIDPEQQKFEAECLAKMESVVTEARVKKIILKCVDEGLVPAQLEPKHIGVLMKSIPKTVYEDLLKEEPEVMATVGALAGKLAGSLTAKHVKSIILGK